MQAGQSARSAVIVISSHVVRGSVGNRAMVFALQSLGFPVWAVPTVVLPWHPGHGLATRIVPDPIAFAALIEDLRNAPWLSEIGAVLSGYLGDAGQAEAVAALVGAVKQRNPRAIYLCDPVIGDQGGLYVPQRTAEAIRDLLLPIADAATPNRFELEWLAGAKLPDNAAVLKAARNAGPATMLVTSAYANQESDIGNLLATHDSVLLVEHGKVAKPPHGTGDLMSALFLAGLLRGDAPATALQSSAASVFEIVRHAVERDADELQLEANAPSLTRPATTLAVKHLD